jgi:hypothetical protein
MAKKKNKTIKSIEKARRDTIMSQGNAYNRTRTKVFKPKNTPQKDRKRFRSEKNKNEAN